MSSSFVRGALCLHGDALQMAPVADISSWWVLPFILFLLMLATGPLFYARFWHRYFPHFSIGMGGGVALYYIFGLNLSATVVHAAVEYVQFISLLTALYFTASGIRITLNTSAWPPVNVLFLLIGGILSNIIGTTGASMLLIRPFISLNKGRIRPYQVVFFIFIVSNVGGALTPVGDPPLFLGFLKGVPFEWTLTHNFLPWCYTICTLLVIFYLFDSYHFSKQSASVLQENANEPGFHIQGKRNFLWLLCVVLAVFLDPNIFSWVPAWTLHGSATSFLREGIMLSVAFLSYRFANKEVLTLNKFSVFPIKEVALVFVGIFGTMIPALELVNQFAGQHAGQDFFTPGILYWSTGLLSGFLDNAPTYLTLLAASMASHGGNIANGQEVSDYALEIGKFSVVNSAEFLRAISIASVFFGACTYIGNGPNFMVRAIAREQGISMPYFFSYIVRYSIPILVPIYALVWWLFLY